MSVAHIAAAMKSTGLEWGSIQSIRPSLGSFLLAPIAVACLVFGVWPKPMIETMQPAIAYHVFGDESVITTKYVEVQPDPPAVAASATREWTSGDNPS